MPFVFVRFMFSADLCQGSIMVMGRHLLFFSRIQNLLMELGCLFLRPHSYIEWHSEWFYGGPYNHTLLMSISYNADNFLMLYCLLWYLIIWWSYITFHGANHSDCRYTATVHWMVREQPNILVSHSCVASTSATTGEISVMSKYIYDCDIVMYCIALYYLLFWQEYTYI